MFYYKCGKESGEHRETFSEAHQDFLNSKDTDCGKIMLICADTGIDEDSGGNWSSYVEPTDEFEEIQQALKDQKLLSAALRRVTDDKDRLTGEIKGLKHRVKTLTRELSAARLVSRENESLLEREGDAASYIEGQLATCEKELEKLKEEHHELNEKYINHSSVYEHKIEQQQEQISKLTKRLSIYQAAYEQEFLKSIKTLTGEET